MTSWIAKSVIHTWVDTVKDEARLIFDNKTLI